MCCKLLRFLSVIGRTKTIWSQNVVVLILICERHLIPRTFLLSKKQKGSVRFHWGGEFFAQLTKFWISACNDTGKKQEARPDSYKISCIAKRSKNAINESNQYCKCMANGKKRFQNWRTAVPYTRRLVKFEVPLDFSRFFEIFLDFTRPHSCLLNVYTNETNK